MLDPIFETNLPGLERYARGKVRDVYAAGDYLVIVATDRLSAFDCVLPTPIPDKGRVLTAMTLFWLDQLRDVVPNHLVSANVADYPREFQPYRDQLEGRSMLVHRANMLPVECVARGYVSGSGWKDYRREGSICGIPLPPGLRESDRLLKPLFTPASKAQSGHDENISFETVASQIGEPLAAEIRDLTLKIYNHAAKYAETRGIIIADTKFEFGFLGGGPQGGGSQGGNGSQQRLVLADEVLTPDSSRFWPRASYRPGGAQPSFDKQYVRDYLESLRWDKKPPAPALPADIIERTSEKYREAYRVLAGKPL